MSYESRHRREPAGDRPNGLVALMSRQRMYVAVVIVAALTFGSAMALVTRGLSHADAIAAASDSPNPGGGGGGGAGVTPTGQPNDDNVTWNPGDITQVNNGGSCQVQMTGSTYGAPDATTASSLFSALSQESGDNVGQDGVNGLGWEADNPNGGTSGTILPDAGVDCSLLNSGSGSGGMATPTATNTVYRDGFDPRTESVALIGHNTFALMRHGSVVSVYQAGLHEAVPQWLKGALGAIAGAVVYTAVSVITVATMVAFGAATSGAGVLASPALAALAGCIGGAVSTAVTIAIATSGGLAGDLAAAVAGCITGGIIGTLPANQVGAWLGNQIGTRLGTVSNVVGAPMQTAATGAGVDLTVVGTGMQQTASALQGA